MENWTLLDEIKYKDVWDFIYDTFLFTPNNGEKVVVIPEPHISEDISQHYDDGFTEIYYDNLHQQARWVFQKIVGQNNRIIALNWQHDCYSFNPHLPYEEDEFGEWLIPVFPNGDYIFFLTDDLQNGLFCDGIALRLTWFGKEMIEKWESWNERIER